MIIRGILIFITFVISSHVYAQNSLIGKVISKYNEPISYVNVIFKDRETNKTLFYTQTDLKGVFIFKNINCDSISKYQLDFRSLGFDKVSKTFSNCNNIENIILEESTNQLNEVIIMSPPVIRKNDTLVYDVYKLKDSTDFLLKDILVKIPGVSINNNGTIYYNNEPINDFQIMGINLMGGRYGVLNDLLQVKNLQSIEILENHNPLKNAPKDYNNPRTGINIVLKNDKLLTGNINAGLGISEAYLAEIKPLIINPKIQSLLTLGVENVGRNIARSFIDHFDSNTENVNFALGIRRIDNSYQSDPRFFRNNSANTSINVIKKLEQEFVIKFNFISTLDRVKESGTNAVKYFKSISDTSLETVETLSNTKKQFKNNLEFGLEKNNKKYFFTYIFKADYNNQNNKGLAELSTLGMFKQVSASNRKQIGNTIQWSKRAGGKRVSFKADYMFQISPQRLNLDKTTTQNFDFIGNLEQTLIINKNALYIVSDISYFKGLNQIKSSFGVQNNIQFLNSNLSVVLTPILNNLKLNSTKVYFNQYFNIKLGDFVFFNTELNIITNPTVTSQPLFSNNLKIYKTYNYLEPRLGLSFRNGYFNNLHLKYARTNTFGDLLQMHPNVILYDYRTVINKNIILARKISDHLSANFRHNNIIKNINLGLGLSYISSINNQFNNLDINNSGGEILNFKNSKFKSQSFSLSGDFMTYNFTKKSKLTISSILFNNYMPISRNGVVFKSKSTYSETKIEGSFFVKNNVKILSGLNIIHTSTTNQNIKTVLNNIAVSEGVLFKLKSNSILIVDYFIDYNSYSRQFNSFLNFKTEKRIKNLVFSLDARNLLNSDIYYSARVNEYFESSTTIQQRPRQIVMSITKNF